MPSRELDNCNLKLKSLCEDVELFAHITSHDLKDPLRQALINLEEDKNTEQTKDSIKKVIEKISLLREYSYLINFHHKLAKTDCDKVLQNALKDLNDYLKAKNPKITYDSLPKLKAYEPHFQIVFSALIKNSICFNNNKEVKLHISCVNQNKFWQFKFSDNGVGIDNVYRKLVFALFQTLNPEDEKSGYGAGLAFCKKIIENHNGKIWFESDGKNGTDFYFTLPV